MNCSAKLILGLEIPDMVNGPWADIASGICQMVQRDGHDICVLPADLILE